MNSLRIKFIPIINKGPSSTLAREGRVSGNNKAKVLPLKVPLKKPLGNLIDNFDPDHLSITGLNYSSETQTRNKIYLKPNWTWLSKSFSSLLILVCLPLLNFSPGFHSIALAQEKTETPGAGPQSTASENGAQEKNGTESNKPKAPVTLPKRTSTLNPQTLRMMELIEKKNRELKEREVELKLKEQALKTLEEQVLADLKKVEDALNKSREQFGMRKEMIDNNINSLVKVYSSMRPDDAATLLGILDEDIAVQIISRMKSKNAGQVMGKMDTKVAKNISEKIAGIRATKKRRK